MENGFKEKISNTLQEPATKLAESRGLHLLRVQVRGTEQTPVIEVLLDGDRDITVDDCEFVSRSLNESIENDKLVKGNFRLDVMSPGIEEPLTHEWQFTRNIGRLVEVHYEDGATTHTVHGFLRESTTDAVCIEPIHVKGKKSAARTVDTIDGEIRLKGDEQLYEDPVALVRVDREQLTKVLVQIDFGGKR